MAFRLRGRWLWSMATPPLGRGGDSTFHFEIANASQLRDGSITLRVRRMTVFGICVAVLGERDVEQ